MARDCWTKSRGRQNKFDRSENEFYVKWSNPSHNNDGSKALKTA